MSAASSAHPLSHHFANLGDVNLHYVTAGSGFPLVLLHGWPQSWYAWRHVLPVLAAKYQVIMPDLRGLGDSSRPLEGYDKKPSATISGGCCMSTWGWMRLTWSAMTGVARPRMQWPPRIPPRCASWRCWM